MSDRFLWDDMGPGITIDSAEKPIWYLVIFKKLNGAICAVSVRVLRYVEMRAGSFAQPKRTCRIRTAKRRKNVDSGNLPMADVLDLTLIVPVLKSTTRAGRPRARAYGQAVSCVEGSKTLKPPSKQFREIATEKDQ